MSVSQTHITHPAGSTTGRAAGQTAAHASARAGARAPLTRAAGQTSARLVGQAPLTRVAGQTSGLVAGRTSGLVAAQTSASHAGQLAGELVRVGLTRDQVMTASEVAELLALPVSTVYYLARQGRLPASRLGRAYRFLRPALERLLEDGGL